MNEREKDRKERKSKREMGGWMDGWIKGLVGWTDRQVEKEIKDRFVGGQRKKETKDE